MSSTSSNATSPPADIRVTWYYAADDEDILETGEDFKADLKLPFELVAGP